MTERSAEVKQLKSIINQYIGIPGLIGISVFGGRVELIDINMDI